MTLNMIYRFNRESNMQISQLQEKFLDFLKTKKTFNIQVLRERTKWQYSLLKGLVKDREAEIGVYKRFLVTVQNVMNTNSVYYLPVTDIVDIYLQVIEGQPHTHSLETEKDTKSVKVRIAGFSCSNCFFENTDRYVYVSNSRSKTYKYNSTCTRCKSKQLTSIVL